MFLSKYGVARHIYIPLVKRAVVDHAVGADWTPVAGDVKISKDGAAAANVTNLPTAIAMGNSAVWDFSLTATEMQAAQVVVTVADSATKAVEDSGFIIETHGHASGQFQVDLADGVRAGLTALPNAAAEAAGGLYTRGSGAGQINQQANGQVDTNVSRWLNTAAAAPNTAGKPLVDVDLWKGSAPNALQTGRVDSYIGALAAAVIAAGSFAAAALDAIADGLLKRDMSAVSGEATRSPLNAFRFLRNKWSISGGGSALTVFKEDDVTNAWTGAVTQTAGNPVSSIDPT